MDENTRYEPRFRPELRRQIGKRAWKVLGLIFLGTAAITLGLRFGLGYGSWNWAALAMPAIIIVLDVALALQHLRQQRWMAQEFCMTEKGILVRGRRRRETLIPWMAIVAADRGTLAVSEQQSVPVIRCFLSTSAWEAFTPNLRRAGEMTALSRYFRLRKECFTLEYTSGREWRIRSGREQNKEDAPEAVVQEDTARKDDRFEADPDFQYAFSEELVDYVPAFFCIWLIPLGIGTVVLLINSLLTHDWSLKNYLAFWGYMLLLLPIIYIVAKPGFWLRKKQRLTPRGVYTQSWKKKETFVPWEDVTEIGREHMGINKYHDVSVICCFKSLTAKTILEHFPKKGPQGVYFGEYERLQDEIITMSYTRERMAKVRALHRAARQKK